MLLTPESDGMWTNKVLDGHTASYENVTGVGDTGISSLLPEIVLAYKARLRSDKDDLDFYDTLPMLTKPWRAWLKVGAGITGANHNWLDQLADGIGVEPGTIQVNFT